MADLRERMVARPSARTAEVIDQGLRSYMLRVYNYMAVGLGLTGLAAVMTFTHLGKCCSSAASNG
jgi:uncharacterized protein